MASTSARSPCSAPTSLPSRTPVCWPARPGSTAWPRRTSRACRPTRTWPARPRRSSPASGSIFSPHPRPCPRATWSMADWLTEIAATASPMAGNQPSAAPRIATRRSRRISAMTHTSRPAPAAAHAGISPCPTAFTMSSSSPATRAPAAAPTRSALKAWWSSMARSTPPTVGSQAAPTSRSPTGGSR